MTRWRRWVRNKPARVGAWGLRPRPERSCASGLGRRPWLALALVACGPVPRIPEGTPSAVEAAAHRIADLADWGKPHLPAWGPTEVRALARAACLAARDPAEVTRAAIDPESVDYLS